MGKRRKAPNGWRYISWRDGQGKKWDDVIPTKAINDIRLKILKAGGKILR